MLSKNEYRPGLILQGATYPATVAAKGVHSFHRHPAAPHDDDEKGAIVSDDVTGREEEMTIISDATLARRCV
jgi:hypothetical protein